MTLGKDAIGAVRFRAGQVSPITIKDKKDSRCSFYLEKPRNLLDSGFEFIYHQ